MTAPPAADTTSEITWISNVPTWNRYVDILFRIIIFWNLRTTMNGVGIFPRSFFPVYCAEAYFGRVFRPDRKNKSG